MYTYVYDLQLYIYTQTHTYTVIHETHRGRACMPMIINSNEGRMYEHTYISTMCIYMLFYGLKTYRQQCICQIRNALSSCVQQK